MCTNHLMFPLQEKKAELRSALDRYVTHAVQAYLT